MLPLFLICHILVTTAFIPTNPTMTMRLLFLAIKLHLLLKSLAQDFTKFLLGCQLGQRSNPSTYHVNAELDLISHTGRMLSCYLNNRYTWQNKTQYAFHAQRQAAIQPRRHTRSVELWKQLVNHHTNVNQIRHNGINEWILIDQRSWVITKLLTLLSHQG